MTVYYVLILLVVSLGVLTGHLKPDVRSSIVVIVGASGIVLIQGLRAHTVGVDLASYIPSYLAMTSVDITRGFRWLNYDLGYLLYSKMFADLGLSVQAYLGVVSATVVVPVALTIRRYSASAWLSLLLYITLGFFAFTFSGLRQSIALAVCFYALRYIQQRRFWVFAVLVLLASAFHWSALVYLVAYPLYGLKIDARWLPALSLGLLMTYVARVSLYGSLAVFLGDHVRLGESTGALGMLIGMVIVFILAYLFGEPTDSVTGGYRNLLLAAVVLQVFASESNTILRMGYYFFLPVVLLIPNVIATQRDKRARLLVTYVVLVAVIAFFHWKTASGYLGVSPYMAYWSW